MSMTLAKAIAALVAAGYAALAQVPATITVQGIGGSSATFSATDLASLPQHTVKVTERDKPVTFEGVLLSDVLAKVTLPTAEKFHKTAASYYMLVEAKDGYRAIYAWAELDSSFMEKPIYVVSGREGKPLDAAEGPFRLVAPGEKRGARWVRQVTALKILQAN